MNNLIWLILGGSAGTIGRYYVSRWIELNTSVLFPYGTLFVNVSGCLILGLLLGVFESRFSSLLEVPLSIRLLVLSGFLGAFTTFSTYEMEAFFYLREGHWEKAMIYLVSSLVLGLVFLIAGYYFSRWLSGCVNPV